MKRILAGCTLAAALTGSAAMAADLPARYQYRAATVPVHSPIYNWTGFYFGINGGWGWGRSQWDGINEFDLSGGLIGGTVGFNWQFSTFVAGLEGDVDWSGIEGTTTLLCAPGCTTRNHWLATARGRLGYAFDRFLPYLTGGLAVGDIDATLPGFPGGSITNAGWTIGGGLEFGMLSNISVKAEYLYVDLGTFNCGFNCALGAGGNVSFYSNILRAGLNVRF